MHSWIWWIIVGVIAGWLTGKIMKGSGFGFFMDMIVGLIGAFIGGFVMTHLGFCGRGRDDLHDHRGGDRGRDSNLAGAAGDGRPGTKPLRSVDLRPFW